MKNGDVFNELEVNGISDIMQKKKKKNSSAILCISLNNN